MIQMAKLKHVHWEDTVVLDISVGPRSARITLDAVLQAEHPLYDADSRSSDGRCWRVVDVEFVKPREVSLLMSTAGEIVGPYGSVDYGDIDDASYQSGRFTLVGECGRFEVQADNFDVRYRDAA